MRKRQKEKTLDAQRKNQSIRGENKKEIKHYHEEQQHARGLKENA